MKKRLILILFCALCTIPHYADAQLVLRQSVIGNGAADVTSSSNSISGTVGQPVIGVVSSSSNVMKGGFWYIPAMFPTGGALTNVGTDVEVQPEDNTTGSAPVTLNFAEVTEAGATTLTTSGTGPPPPSGLKLGDPPTYYDLTTTAVFSGQVGVCIDYSGTSFSNESNLQLFHFVDGNWVNVTTSLNTDADIICGSVTSLSAFAILENPTENLIATVKDMNLQQGIENSLTSKLENVIAKLEKGNVNAAINQLEAFINQVEAKRGKKNGLTDKQAVVLIAAAQDIITMIPDEEGPAKRVASQDIAEIPETFSLSQNSPNPFNPATTISYGIPAGKSEHVRLNVYDLRGALVMKLVNQVTEPGFYTVIWDGTDKVGNKVSSGIYIYQLQSGEFTKSNKMILLR